MNESVNESREASIQNILQALEDEDESIRRHAVRHLHDDEDEIIVTALVSRLADHSAAVREAATETLSRIGRDITAKSLLHALWSEDIPFRNNACLVLRNIGEPAIKHLIPLIQDPNQDVQKFVVDILAGIHHPLVEDALIEALQGSTNINVISAVIEALGNMRCKQAVGSIVVLLQNPNSWVCCSAAQSLGKIATPDAVQALIHVLDNDDEMVVYTAVQALGDCASVESIVPLFELMSHSNPLIVNSLILSLDLILTNLNGLLSDSLKSMIKLEPIIQLLQHSQVKMRFHAASFLGKVGHSEMVVMPLVHALIADENRPEMALRELILSNLVTLRPKNPQPIVDLLAQSIVSNENCCELIDLLGRLKYPQAFDTALTFLQNTDPRIRRVVVRILADIDSVRSVEPLLQSLQDSDMMVQMNALQGLSVILKTPIGFKNEPLLLQKVITTLISILEQHPNLDIRESAAQILIATHPEKAIQILFNLLNSTSVTERILGIRGLAPLTKSNTQIEHRLKNLSTDESPFVCAEVLTILAALEKTNLSAEMLLTLTHIDAKIQCSTIKLLSKPSSEESVNWVRTLFQKDPDLFIRYQCTLASVELQSADVVDMLVNYLSTYSTAEQFVALGAIESLAKIGDTRALNILEFLSQSTDMAIENILSRLKHIAISTEMLLGLEHTDAKVRRLTVKLLAKHPSQEAVDWILKLFQKDRDLFVRYQCALALAEQHATEAIEILVNYLSSYAKTEEFVVLGVIQALTTIGDKRAIHILGSLSQSIDSEVAESATEALISILNRKRSMSV